MNAKELRLGNWFQDEYTGDKFQVVYISDGVIGFDYETSVKWQAESIPITEEILRKCGFYQMEHRTVTNSWTCDLDWNRGLSIGFVGTPNEMVFLYEVDENAEGLREITDIVIVHNYDYNGMLFLHQLQNLYFSITNKELEVKL